MSSMRTSMKMQLQRDQTIQEEKKSKSIQNFSGRNSTNAISLPPSATPQPVLPAAVLKVETELQNPTRYHVQETQRNQVMEYLSKSQDASKNAVRRTLGTRLSAPSGDGFQKNNVPASPFSKLHLSASVDNQSDNVSDIFENVSYDSSYGEEQRYGTPSATVSTVSPTNLNRFSQNAAQKLNVVSQENTSSSCPTIKREMSEEEFKNYSKERMKKDNHNIIERRRRYNINDRIRELGQMVPKSLDPDARWNKGTILKAAVDYIHSLQKEQTRVRQAEMRAQEMESINKQLHMRVQQLEAGFQHHGIAIPSFDSPSVHGGMDQMTPFNPSSNQSPYTSRDNHSTGNFSVNPLSPSLPSPGLMGAHPHSSTQGMMQMQPNGSPLPSNYLSPQPSVSSVYPAQQHLLGNQSNLSPQHGHQMSPSVSTNHFCFSPIPNVLSPHNNSIRHLSEPSISTSGAMANATGDMGNFDMSGYEYGHMTNGEMADGSFSAMLSANDTTNFNDVMMNDFTVKDDIMLSDATNRQ